MCVLFFFQAEDGIRDLVRSRGLGDVYKRQRLCDSKGGRRGLRREAEVRAAAGTASERDASEALSLIHI